MKEASIIGLDLSKRSFQAHGTLARLMQRFDNFAFVSGVLA